MTRVAVSLLLAATLVAQQPNSPGASLEINGEGGPPWPIVNVAVPVGITSQFVFLGAPGVPIGLIQGSNLQTGALPTPFGIVDLDLTPFAVILFGEVMTDINGAFTFSVPVPAAVPQGVSVAFQGVLPDPSSVVGTTLTAASSVLTTPGVYTQTLALSNDSYAQVSLVSRGFEAVFYDQIYGSAYVNSNGSVSFGAGLSDFTPSISEHLGVAPRIALLWTDLAPNLGGSVSWTLDQTGSVPELRVDFLGVRESPSAQTFDLSYSQQLRPTGSTVTAGDITISHGMNPGGPVADSLVGISPGFGLSPLSTPTDLSAAVSGGGILGGPRDALFELFNNTMGTGANPYDLSNVHLTFVYVPPLRYALQ